MSIFDAITAQVAETARAVQGGQAPAEGQQQQGGLLSWFGEPVDVEALLEKRMADKGNPNLNWRTSIADLMRLLDLDPSLENRKELATELGYDGEKNGSAEMNIWLHKKVMKGLADNGGKVPAGMAD